MRNLSTAKLGRGTCQACTPHAAANAAFTPGNWRQYLQREGVEMDESGGWDGWVEMETGKGKGCMMCLCTHVMYAMYLCVCSSNNVREEARVVLNI